MQLCSRRIQVDRIRHGLLRDFLAGQRTLYRTGREGIRTELAGNLQRLLSQSLCYQRLLPWWAEDVVVAEPDQSSRPCCFARKPFDVYPMSLFEQTSQCSTPCPILSAASGCSLAKAVRRPDTKGSVTFSPTSRSSKTELSSSLTEPFFLNLNSPTSYFATMSPFLRPDHCCSQTIISDR